MPYVSTSSSTGRFLRPPRKPERGSASCTDPRRCVGGRSQRRPSAASGNTKRASPDGNRESSFPDVVVSMPFPPLLRTAHLDSSRQFEIGDSCGGLPGRRRSPICSWLRIRRRAKTGTCEGRRPSVYGNTGTRHHCRLADSWILLVGGRWAHAGQADGDLLPDKESGCRELGDDLPRRRLLGDPSAAQISWSGVPGRPLRLGRRSARLLSGPERPSLRNQPASLGTVSPPASSVTLAAPAVVALSTRR